MKEKHEFIERLGDYDLLCNGVKACFVPYLIARHQAVRCPACGQEVKREAIIAET